MMRVRLGWLLLVVVFWGCAEAKQKPVPQKEPPPGHEDFKGAPAERSNDKGGFQKTFPK
jgi:hypothetical protein